MALRGTLAWGLNAGELRALLRYALPLVPAGVAAGQKLRLKEKGIPPRPNAPRGDLLLVLRPVPPATDAAEALRLAELLDAFAAVREAFRLSRALAALRAGITHVIVPERNVPDLEEIPREAKRRLRFIPVSTMEQVLESAERNQPTGAPALAGEHGGKMEAMQGVQEEQRANPLVEVGGATPEAVQFGSELQQSRRRRAGDDGFQGEVPHLRPG